MTKKHLITSALPYINGVKHLGNLVGSMLPGDVYARYLRQQGEEVLYICGTDEHGTPAEIAAEAAGKDVAAYCEDMYTIQKDIYERFGISFDYFGRSSMPANHKLTQELFLQMRDNNYIEEREILQYYSHADHRFLPDRYVEGTCPSCGYTKARGDQCDGCGRLLEPTDLKDPYSAISGSKDIELQSTKHIFLLLDKLTEPLEAWVATRPEWPDGVKGIAKKWLKEGLQPRCITRDLKWGVPVPLDGYDNKVFYVWFDAPNGYISITQDWAASIGQPDAWKAWWQDLEAVHYVQFMAKDNVPFHSIFWPAMLMATGQPWKQVDYIKGVNWLTYDKGKFSTSQKRGVFTDVALELYPADYWRYYLMANCPESDDADFTFAHFAAIINKDLADILGNFANRSFSLIHKYFEGRLPVVLDQSSLDQGLLTKVSTMVADYQKSLSDMKFRQACAQLRGLWVLANEYITVNEPWKTAKTDLLQAGVCLSHCIYLLRLFAILGHSLMPTVSLKILALLNDPLTESEGSTAFAAGLEFTAYKAGHLLADPVRLFEKIEDDRVAELTAQYDGH
ncbi:methionine--tRNA ligase [Candidatus Odyssella acanthamoebae]|uniref:Methionine--tRNA ligase n=1 Tax=Candidatus Odyssella acanthamoebae TaxID=91604 RepID=A0A077AWM6_9PROT|nr:methionine--tRNA ligase [Candidatus Paracaedibacter acanthamoebae]AIK96871.1 methionyl-tRNA synthetase [Candidatus Paracaedibacter acanthamoebae]